MLLPGHDGTGDFFAPVIDALGSNVQTQIVRYPLSDASDYVTCENIARAALPIDRPYVLLGFNEVMVEASLHRSLAIAFLTPPSDGDKECCGGRGLPREAVNGRVTIQRHAYLQNGDVGLHALCDLQRCESIVHHRARSEAHLPEGQRLSHTGSYAWNLASGEFGPDERFRVFGFDPTVKPTLELMLERIHPDYRAAVRQRADEAAPY